MLFAQVYACAFYIDGKAASAALRSNGATAEAVRTIDGAADALLAGPFRCRPHRECWDLKVQAPPRVLGSPRAQNYLPKVAKLLRQHGLCIRTVQPVGTSLMSGCDCAETPRGAEAHLAKVQYLCFEARTVVERISHDIQV